jgi:opacity protein-like surface antigen
VSRRWGAAEAQWYFSGNLGVNILSDLDFQDRDTAGNSAGGESSHDTGYVFSAAGGYSWGRVRVEGEMSYRQNDLDQLTVTSVTLAGFGSATGLATASLSGDSSAFGVMINGWYDVDTGSPWTPFFSAGIGFASVNLNIENVGGVAVNFDESDTVFAYQVGAGLGYKLNQTTTLTLTYRYFGTSDPEFSNGVDTIDGEYQSHSVAVGAIERF